MASLKGPAAWAWRQRLLWLPLLIGLPLVGVSLGLAFRFWPAHWEKAAQATLAAALIAQVGAVMGLIWNTTFQELLAISAHRRELRGKLMERFLANRTAYYSQLIAVAGELASSLRAVANNPTEQDQLDLSFYHSARFLELVAVLRARFQRLAPFDHPAGLTLRSGAVEDQVWDLILEPWTFGYWDAEQQSSLLASLRKSNKELVSPQDFLIIRGPTAGPQSAWASFAKRFSRRTRTPAVTGEGLRSAWASFAEKFSDPAWTYAVAEVLYLLSAVLDYETGRIIDPWYEQRAPYPHQRIQDACDFFKTSSVKPFDLRVKLPPPCKDTDWDVQADN